MDADHQDFINRKYFSAVTGLGGQGDESRLGGTAPKYSVDIIMKGYISLIGRLGDGAQN